MLYGRNLSPEGLEDLLDDEYKFKYETIKILENVFEGFGYNQIMTPTLEYYELYSKIEDPIFKEHMFKLIDTDGKILVLRPDATIPVARMAVNNYKNESEYLKFFYITNIFRLNKHQNGEKREFIQGGIEYLGNEKVDCDGEVIAIAIKSLMKCGINDFHIDLGHAQFLDSVINMTSLNEIEKLNIYQLIEKKNYGDLKQYLTEIDIPSSIKEVLIKIPRLYGEPEKVLLGADNLVLNDEMKKALSNLRDVYNIIKDYGFQKYIHFDLGFTKSMSYYTGVIFKGYSNNFGELILSGGRYDKLTEHFGDYKPACGFGLNINKLVEVIEMLNIKKEKEKESYIDYLILYKDIFRGKAISLAEELREKGFIVASDSYKNSIRGYFDNPKFKNTKEVIEIDEGYLKIISNYKNQVNRCSINQFIKALDSEVLVSIH